MNNKIVAVIVTYNRLELLKEAIQAVKAQTELPKKVIIVNNNSTDDTKEYLESIKSELITPVHLEENLGGAGGFYHGIKKAYNEEADWVWIMDDDTIATPTALEKLVNSPMFEPKPMFEQIGFLASQVDWTNGERCRMNIPSLSWEWNWFHDKYPGCYRVNAASFVSILINRKAIERVGYPIKELFIWFDDWEYTQRISAHGDLPCFYVKDSVVVHKTPSNLGVSYADINENNIWKYKYGIRNEVSLTNTSKSGFVRACLLILTNLKVMKENNISVKLQYRILKSGVKGLFFKYKKYIEIVKEN